MKIGLKYSGSMLTAAVWKRRCTEKKSKTITEGLMVLSYWKPINYYRYTTKSYRENFSEDLIAINKQLKS